MAISVVHRSTGYDAATGTVKASFPSNTAGNAIIVITSAGTSTNTDLNTVPTDTKGNTYTKQFTVDDTANGMLVVVWACYNILGTGVTNQVSESDASNDTSMAIFEVSGLVTSSGADKDAFQDQLGATSLNSTNTPTTTVANELLIGVFTSQSNTGEPAWVVGSGYSNLQHGGGSFAWTMTEEKIVSATGAYNATASQGSNGDNVTSCIFTFKGASGSSFSTTPTDTAKFTDTIVKSIGRIQTDNESLSDSQIRSTGKIVSDNEKTSDLGIKNIQKSLSDNEGFNDLSIKGLGKVSSDNQGLLDSTLRSLGKVENDSQGFSDAIGPRQIGKVSTDSQKETDSSLKSISRSPLNDTQSQSDVVIKSLPKILLDNESISDSQSKFTGKIGSDSQSITDTLNKASGKGVNDTSGSLDAILRAAQKTFSDTVGFSESITVIKSTGQHYAITLTDTLGQIDSILKGPNKVPTDIQLSSDTIAPRQLGKVQIDTQFALDTIKKSFSRNALTDNFKASDIVTKNPNKINSDNQGSSDTLGARQINKVVNDTQGFGNEGISIIVHGLVNEEAGITIDVIAPPVFVDSLVSSIYMESNIVTTILNNPPVKANSMSVKANSLTVYATDAYTGVIGSVGADNTGDVTPEVIPDGVYVPIINNYL